MDLHKFEERMNSYIEESGFSQAAVARKLNYSPDQFNKWLKAVNRVPDIAIQRFSDLFKLTDEQQAELFDLAGYVAVDQLKDKAAPDVLTLPPSYLPPKTYNQLIGREAEMIEVMKLLHGSEQRLVNIVGLGGMGKTALAYEVVHSFQQEKLFDYIVWWSAKTEHFEGEHIIRRDIITYNFDELLSEIGRQCQRLDVAQMAPDQKQAAVRWLLANKRVLVVLDNLETVEDNEQLIGAIFQILGKSRLLITSRHQLKHEAIYTMNLRGLSDVTGIDFLRVEGKTRNIQEVAIAADNMLLEIHQVTGGAPLAMKLVVGQLSRQPMGVVLTALKRVSRQGQDYELYRFIYWYSWGLLSEEAKGLLVDMSVFPPITGGAVADIETISQVGSDLFWIAVDQLVVMSLMDKSGLLGQERYALHPLTHYFVLSDITEEWRDDSV